MVHAAPLSGLNANMDGVVVASGTVTSVLTTAANNVTANDVRLGTGSSPTSSIAYFGMNYIFNQLTFNIGTAGTVGVVTWEYCSAATATCTTWSALSPTDGTTSFKTSGTNNVTFSVPTDWVTSRAGDGVDLYYVRARATTAYAVEPLATQISAMEFDLKLKVKDELGTAQTGLLSGAFTFSSCVDLTKYAFRETGSGAYEFGLLTTDNNCSYTVTSSGFASSTPALTGQLASTLTDLSISAPISLSYAYKVTSIKDELNNTLTGVTVKAGDTQSVSCTESSGAWYCPVPVSHTDLNIRVEKDGYVSASTSVFSTDRTKESDAQQTGTVSGMKFSLKVSVTDSNGGSPLSQGTVVAGDSQSVTCVEQGGSGSYYCAIPLAHTGMSATFQRINYTGVSGTYTDRVLGIDPQSTLSLSTAGGGGGGGSGGPLPTPSPTPTPSATPNPSSTPTPPPVPNASPLPVPVSSNAAVTLYRVEGDPRVYAVVNHHRRHIPSLAAFNANGFHWADVQVFTPANAPAYVEIKLMRAKGDAKVYVIQNDTKVWIKTAADFAKGGYKWEDVVEVPAAELAAYIGASGGSGVGSMVLLKGGIGRLNVRALPSVSGKKVGFILPSQGLVILEMKNGWYRIELSSGTQGWALGSYLQMK